MLTAFKIMGAVTNLFLLKTMMCMEDKDTENLKIWDIIWWRLNYLVQNILPLFDNY